MTAAESGLLTGEGGRWSWRRGPTGRWREKEGLGGQRDGRERRGVTRPEWGWAAAEHTREMADLGFGPSGGKRGEMENRKLNWAVERGRPSRPSGQEWEEEFFLFFISFSKPNSSMNQSQIQMGFQTHFSLQSELRNFGKFSKNKFYTFLNSFLFFYLKAIFNFICKSIFKPLNQIHQMQGIYA